MVGACPAYKPSITSWQEILKVIGVQSVPQLPFYFGHCPQCDRPVRFMDDCVYLDGWWGCEACNIGGHPLEYAAHHLNTDYTDLRTQFTNQAYFDTALQRINGFKRGRKVTNAIYSHKYAPLVAAVPHFTALGVPRITSFATAARIYAQTRAIFSTRVDLIQSLPSFAVYRNCPRIRSKNTWTHPHSRALIVRCMDMIGRVSGLTLCSAAGQVEYYALLPEVRRLISHRYLGFTFGNALWCKTAYKKTFKDTIFVVPVKHALKWQFSHLQESALLLPMIAFQCVKNATLPLFRVRLWHTWNELKQFIFWSPTHNYIMLQAAKLARGRYFVGKLPAYLQDAPIKQTLKYIQQQATDCGSA